MNTFYSSSSYYKDTPTEEAGESLDAATEPLRTRAGYSVADAVKQFKSALEQSGAASAGKSLHFTADLICSGCIVLWQKLLWDYAFDHVGIASPRIFHFLKQRFAQLDMAYKKVPAEQFYRMIEYQKSIAECLLLSRACPRRPPLKMPKVPAETHTNEWVMTNLTGPSAATPSLAVGRVFKHGSDLPILRRVGNEFAKSCAEGATERALFWMKWLFEEELYLKKQKEGQLSTLERGPPGLPPKSRCHVGHFLVEVLKEIYRDLAPKTGLRIAEEFQSLLTLYGTQDKRITQRRRVEALCLCIQILCEVPRWKVPAAPSLVADPVALERAVSHAESFFREVLAFDAPIGDIEKVAMKAGKAKGGSGAKPMDAKKRKELALAQQLADTDAMLESWMGGS